MKKVKMMKKSKPYTEFYVHEKKNGDILTNRHGFVVLPGNVDGMTSMNLEIMLERYEKVS